MGSLELPARSCSGSTKADAKGSSNRARDGRGRRSTEEASNDRGGKGPSNPQAGKGHGVNPHSTGSQTSLTKLERVARRSQEDRKAVFNNLGHLLDLDLLRRCFHRLDGKKAVGIDGMRKEDYEKKLESNLSGLLQRIRKGSYHPQPSRIVEIPKADGSKRPLAISCLEDKIVQAAIHQILERIYEPIFLNCSHGFRPGRGYESALRALDNHLMDWNCGAVLEIDLKKYFNTIPHERLIELLELKIQDPRFLHLIIKLLKAPTLNEEGMSASNE